MTRPGLILTTQPYEIQIFVRFKRTDGLFEPIIGIIDTGAEISLFPKTWLEVAEHKLFNHEIVIEQAGIARQAFNAVEAEIALYCEDLQANQSQPMTVRAWFADTTKVIIGFNDILDHAKFYVDFQETRTGWVEL